MTNIITVPSYLETKYSKIEKVNSFIYLCEILQMKMSKKETSSRRRENTAIALCNYYFLYKKKTTSRQAKLRCYNTVIKIVPFCK